MAHLKISKELLIQLNQKHKFNSYLNKKDNFTYQQEHLCSLFIADRLTTDYNNNNLGVPFNKNVYCNFFWLDYATISQILFNMDYYRYIVNDNERYYLDDTVAPIGASELINIEYDKHLKDKLNKVFRNIEKPLYNPTPTPLDEYYFNNLYETIISYE